MLRRAAPFALLGLLACASDTDVREEVARLRHEIYDLRTDLRRAQEGYDELTAQVEQLRRSGPAQPRAAAPARSRPAVAAPPPLPVVRVSADGAERPIEDDLGAIDDGSPPILIKMGPDPASENVGVDPSVLARPDPVLSRTPPASGRSPEETYEHGLSVLRVEHDPGRARILLAAFEREHPKSSLADNAAYWTGEAEFMLAEYAAAASTFTRVLDQYPQSGKRPYALLRLAESLHELGRTPSAVARLEELVGRHPNSPAAQTARERLELWRSTQKGKM